MATEIEWQRRIDLWRNELPKQCYRPLGSLVLEGFSTFDQLSVAQVQAGDFVPMPAGTAWGAKWEYYWFRTSVVIPAEAAGKRIVVHLAPGGESAVYVNGQHAGAIDWGRPELTLSVNAVPGTVYDLLIESYGGHGPITCGGGPVPPDRETVPEAAPTQVRVGESSFGIWEEEVYQLNIEVTMLDQMREFLEQESLRVAEIKQAMRDFSVIVDFEVPYDDFLATVRAARARLQPLFACVNGTSTPELHAFGHSHIDVAWLWPLRETEAKCTRTFASQLALMDEYPDYVFLQSQPHLYWMVKNRYPELYARVKAQVAEGRWIAEGGMWVEADTNISSGESLIRQFLHGKRFFRDEFGVDNEMLWLPDVFGYSGNLPQIMRGCGIKYFSTQKIYWLYNGGDPFPYTTFTWEGIDGSEVLVSMHHDYNSQTDPRSLNDRWRNRVQKIGLSTRLVPFGWGDGGGGPTRTHLEYLRRCTDLEGVPRVRQTNPLDHFKDLEERGYPQDRYVGELYFQCHRGVLTSQARTKKGNRKSEFALREAEMWSAAARNLTEFAIPAQELDLAWKQVLLNQFHDIIPGSSIHRVYEEAEAGYARVIATAQSVAAQAHNMLTDDKQAITVFNSLGWMRSDLVALPAGMSGASQDELVLAVQEIERTMYAEVSVPSCGWTTLLPAHTTPAVENTLSATTTSLENELLRVEFNDKGEIVSLFDKVSARELATGPCNSFAMYKDVPSSFDAWDIDHTYVDNPVELTDSAKIDIVSSGPLVAILRITRQLHNSTLTQQVCLRRGSHSLEFVTKIDWQEKHKLLKVAFPVAIHSNEAIHEIQFGHLRRPNHASRQFDADRFEVAQQKWTALAEENRGVAVLNDCKYGVNVVGNSINLTLLRSPMAPDMTADLGVQQFTYSLYTWHGAFADSELVQQAYALNIPLTTAPGGGGECSTFTVSAPNVIIETVKPADDGSDDVIVRLYEAYRMATRCTLQTSLAFAGAISVNMLEEGTQPLHYAEGAVQLDFTPFEVKTVRMTVCVGC